jgi:hypothetical protein
VVSEALLALLIASPRLHSRYWQEAINKGARGGARSSVCAP